jgi:hypothetical protein
MPFRPIRRAALVAPLAAALVSLGSVALAADTLSGEIVDLACYMPHPEPGHGSGPGHRKCADTCLKKGLPMGLVTDDQQVWLLLEDHQNPKPYATLKDKAAEHVTIEGTKTPRGGVNGFVVETVK